MPPVKKATTKAPVKKAASTAGKTSPAKKATPKAASSKSTTTKVAVKKATVTKTAPKAVAKLTAKAATKVGGEISVHGRKVLQTLQKEFSKKFEYLLIGFIIDADKDKYCNVKCIDTRKTISEARKKASDKELSMHGRSMVKSIEEYFWKDLGIACQIGVSNYLGHEFYFPIGSFNEKTLTAANEWAKAQGCNKITPALVAKACNNNIF